MSTCRHEPAPPIHPEQLEELDAAAEITPQDIAAAREFWGYWGTPLFNAMLDAEAEPARKPGRSQ